jgi:hypothetical protein
MLVNSSSVLSQSRDSASATLFSEPGNHWLYSLIPWERYCRACFRATSIRTDAWMSSSEVSRKFVFRSQPSDVVLSVMESTQSPSVSRPAMMSIQGVMIAARCSNRLFDALKRRASGTFHRQANPSWLYPPRPCGHESER